MSASRTVFFEFCLIVCCASALHTGFLSCFGLFVTLVPCALSLLTSVWLFVTLLPYALFPLSSVRLFARLVPCALFSVTSV